MNPILPSNGLQTNNTVGHFNIAGLHLSKLHLRQPSHAGPLQIPSLFVAATIIIALLQQHRKRHENFQHSDPNMQHWQNKSAQTMHYVHHEFEIEGPRCNVQIYDKYPENEAQINEDPAYEDGLHNRAYLRLMGMDTIREAGKFQPHAEPFDLDCEH